LNGSTTPLPRAGRRSDQSLDTGNNVNETRNAALRRAFGQAEDFLDGLDQRAVGATASPDKPRARISTDDQRWAAVAARDRAADGAFWYGVCTTGVYCRPGCSSRLPNRKNVVFFGTCAAAEQQGFRPCKRCQPDQGTAHLPVAVIKACRIIDSASRAPALPELARAVGLSPSHFHRLFRSALGITPRAYAETRRVERLRERLGSGTTVTGAMLEAGFASGSRLYETADDHLGMKPGTVQRQGRGEQIQYVFTRCSLGWLAVAMTARGICHVGLGDTRAEVRQELAGRFRHATLQASKAGSRQWIRMVVNQIDGKPAGNGLPLDIRGTAFQRRVWEALQAVPAGTTVTYSRIARMIGKPAAVRAVARACAANELAVLIPCHRVVRNDGIPGGYRWGAQRKGKLLERERRKD
jgi:AraC family transcriptional regulator, regulatory protein of adaptative response / methylated-DNA-[protein]-cysteine methyltransferase